METTGKSNKTDIRKRQLEDLLSFRIMPLRRFLMKRLEKSMEDLESMDMEEYEEEESKLLRVQGIYQRILIRLYPETLGYSPLDIWLDQPEEAQLPQRLL